MGAESSATPICSAGRRDPKGRTFVVVSRRPERDGGACRCSSSRCRTSSRVRTRNPQRLPRKRSPHTHRDSRTAIHRNGHSPRSGRSRPMRHGWRSPVRPFRRRQDRRAPRVRHRDEAPRQLGRHAAHRRVPLEDEPQRPEGPRLRAAADRRLQSAEVRPSEAAAETARMRRAATASLLRVSR